jgi:uncharacterized protein
MDWGSLADLIRGQFVPGVYSIHGPDHWRRVERNGLLIARENGADVLVVRLFALFHDSRRLNDDSDPQHGPRGAILASQLHGDAFTSTVQQLSLLVEACRDHTSGMHHPDPTIGACRDADRLDLGRVGITPHERFMSTETGRRLARDRA